MEGLRLGTLGPRHPASRTENKTLGGHKDELEGSSISVSLVSTVLRNACTFVKSPLLVVVSAS